MELAIAADNLTKTFGRSSKAVHALQGVTLSVERGEIFSLLGPNGAGKTTFIKCLLGVVFADSGMATLLGSKMGSVQAKQRIGYLPENHRYPLHLTGGQVLDYFGKLSGLQGSKLRERIDYTLHLVGMNDWRRTKVRKYSKGMMQRLGLAQALLNDPDLIILDEPTDGVDPVGRKEIRDLLVGLKGLNKTIFLNSHLLSEVERISDRVAIMDHGRMIRIGSVEELTRMQSRYQIIVTPEHTGSALALLHSKVLGAKDNAFEVPAQSFEELNDMIDMLRSNGILIESISPVRSSLEDFFLSLIGTSELQRQ